MFLSSLFFLIPLRLDFRCQSSRFVKRSNKKCCLHDSLCSENKRRGNCYSPIIHKLKHQEKKSFLVYPMTSVWARLQVKNFESGFPTAFHSFIWYLCCCCSSPEELRAEKSGGEINLSQPVDCVKWMDVINWAECWRLPGPVPVLRCLVLKLASYSRALFTVHTPLPGKSGKGISFHPPLQKSTERHLKTFLWPSETE